MPNSTEDLVKVCCIMVCKIKCSDLANSSVWLARLPIWRSWLMGTRTGVSCS